jgi:hypothetical protein
VLDVTHLRPLREQAFALHAGQTSPMDDMPDELRAGFLERDYLIRLQPPWPGGAPEGSLF